MWKTVKLGDICDILDKLRRPITKKNRISGDIPYYGATGIVDWVAEHIFDERLVLVGEDGAKWGCGDETAFIIDGKSWVNNHAHVLRPHLDKVLHEWISYYLTATDLSPWVAGLTVPKLNQAQLRSIPLPLPPLAEQQRIVAKLDAAFAEIGKVVVLAETKETGVDELREALLASLLNYDAVQSTHGTIGDALEVIQNGINCKQNKSGIGDKITRIETIADSDINYSRTGFSVLNGKQREKSRLIKGEILFSHINSPIHVGKTAIYDGTEPLYHGINLLRLRTIDSVESSYFNFFLQSLFYSGYWKQTAKQSVNQASVNQTDIKSVSFSYPPLAEQQRIVAKLETAVAELEAAKSAISKSQERYQALKLAILAQELQASEAA